MLGCRFMAELGKVVPILPIVTKADSMTIREAATYRREVYRKLQNPQLPEPQGNCHHPPPYHHDPCSKGKCICVSVCVCWCTLKESPSQHGTHTLPVHDTHTLFGRWLE